MVMKNNKMKDIVETLIVDEITEIEKSTGIKVDVERVKDRWKVYITMKTDKTMVYATTGNLITLLKIIKGVCDDEKDTI